MGRERQREREREREGGLRMSDVSRATAATAAASTSREMTNITEEDTAQVVQDVMRQWEDLLAVAADGELNRRDNRCELFCIFFLFGHFSNEEAELISTDTVQEKKSARMT